MPNQTISSPFANLNSNLLTILKNNSNMPTANSAGIYVPLLKTDDGQVLNAAREKAELLNNTFSTNSHLNAYGKVPPAIQPRA